MTAERIKIAIEQVVQRIPATKGRGEEAAKQALILPIIAALGYDIHNPLEVCPEHDADFAIRKGAPKDRVDIAILQDDAPVIFIEAKASDVALDDHVGQLSRYFNSAKSVVLGILTNGIEWRFFTDTADQNIMDQTPFHSFRVDYASESDLTELSRIAKGEPFVDNLREHASNLLYTARLADFLRNELDLKGRQPSDYLVKWALRGQDANGTPIYSGSLGANAIAKFQPIVKAALELARGDVSTKAAPVAHAEIEPVTSESANGMPVEELTEQERLFFDNVVAICKASPLAAQKVFDPGTKEEMPIEFGCKRTASYLGIYFNKYWWWFMRVNFRAVDIDNWIGFNMPPEVSMPLIPTGYFSLMPSVGVAPTRLACSDTNNLDPLKPVILAAFEREVKKYLR